MSEFVITLVSASQPLDSQHFDVLKDLKVSSRKDLGTDKAADFFTSEKPDLDQIKQWRRALKPLETDIFVSLVENRRKNLLLSDMDSTMIKSETLDDVADVLNLKDEIASITNLAMAGKIDYIESLEKRVALLEGLDFKAFEDHLQHIPYMDGGKTLVKTMKANDATTVLVSSGFTIFTNYVAEKIGFDHNHGNVLVVNDNGQLSGKVEYPVLDGTMKKKILKDYINELSLSLDSALTIGDGANDLMMLSAAQDKNGLGIGYHPKPLLEDALYNVILYNDLTAALFAQGYSKDQFVT